MKYFSSFPFSGVGLLVIPIAIFVVWMNIYSPEASKAPSPYSSVILAFEFVNNPKDLVDVFEPLTKQEIRNLDKLNYVDFGFMIVYSFFLFLFLRKTTELTKSHSFRFLLTIPPLILLFDFCENIQLLRLSKLYQSDMVTDKLSDVIPWLQFSTWFKWSLLAIALAGIGVLLWKMASRLPRFLSILLMIPLVLLIISKFGEVIWIDRFSGSIFSGFFLLLLFCFSYKTSARPQS